MKNIFNQAPFQCRMDWGIRGVKEASLRGDIIVIVDVLRFASLIANAVHEGSIVYPFTRTGDINEFGKLVGAEVFIQESSQALELGLPSLLVTSFDESHKGKRYVISSFNGATCVKEAGKNNYIFMGCLLNISAVASAVNQIQKDKNLNITLIASGEIWSGPKNEPKDLRPSIEDYLVAGAILELLDGSKSPEAKVCIGAYQNSKSKLKELILDSGSGRELLDMGLSKDVEFCLQFDIFKEAPILTQDIKGYSYFKDFNK